MAIPTKLFESVRAIRSRALQNKLSLSLPKSGNLEVYMESVLGTLPDADLERWTTKVNAKDPRATAEATLLFCHFAGKFQRAAAQKDQANFVHETESDLKFINERRAQVARDLFALANRGRK